MTIELVAAIIFFGLSVFALLFSLTKSSHVDAESFPNRTRYYVGLVVWIIAAILAVFVSFPGYAEWFVPIVYPVLKISLLTLFMTGFFMILTTLTAFPIHMNFFRREIDGRSDRIALLENIRQITVQPYPITELFTLVLKELSSFLVLKKGAIFLINPSRREMYLVAQIGLDREELGRLERYAMGQDIVSRAAAEQIPFVSGDLATSDTSSRKLILAGRNITLSAAAMPLSSRDRSLGALLVLSDKPYRFEKQDRMLLNAAAEAITGVVETNRLTRENQKLTKYLDESQAKLANLRESVAQLMKSDDPTDVLSRICRHIVERYNIAVCRVVKPVDGGLHEITRFEATPEVDGRGEAYQIAVIEAIRRKKMVVLNQEARGQDGGIYVSQSTLLCPFTLWIQTEFALLVEAPGNGLPLNKPFMSDIDSAVGLAALALNILALKETDAVSHKAVQSLLHILRIKRDTPQPVIFKQFLAETESILPPDSTALVFVADKRDGYHIKDACNLSAEELTDICLSPGEGPVGKVFTTGDILEYSGSAKIEEGWDDMEPMNKDFFGRLFGEKGIPNYQLNIPVKILDRVDAVIAIFSHCATLRISQRERGLLLLAVHLLSIKLSMAGLDDQVYAKAEGDSIGAAGDILNRANNDLSAIIGWAEMLERQHDVSGRARHTAGEILKAAESVASSIKRLQEATVSPEGALSADDDLFSRRLDELLEGRRITGNLFMFDNNRPVMLQKELIRPSRFRPQDDDFFQFIEMILQKFVELLEEGDEVLVKSDLHDEHFYISLVRGSREKQKQFSPFTRDFGDPDVLPGELFGDELIRTLAKNNGEVSFDRFGRRPTYISFRFPHPEAAVHSQSAMTEKRMSTLKILAIDDQQMILDLLSGICQSLGLELTAVREPSEGIKLFRLNKYDIVMIDLAMGRASGWAVAGEIKDHSPDTPVIMMTGWGIDVTAEEATRAGVDFTLAKPFKIEQLTDIIERARLKLTSS